MMEGGRSVLKRRLARVFRVSSLLRSTCTPSASTAAAASNRSIASDIAGEPAFVPASRRHLLHDQLEHSLSFPSSDDPRGRRRVAVGWGSVDCGSCRSMRALEFGLVKKEMGENGIAKKKERRVRETGGFYETGDGEGWTCPPASPSSPSKSYYYDCFDKEGEEKKEKSAEKKNKKKLLSNGYGFSSSSSVDSDDEVGFFSSEERETKEVETETLFSSKSFSSDSFEFYKRPSSNNDRKKKKNKKKKKSSHRPPIRGVRSRNDLHARDGFKPLVSISSKEKKKEKERVDEEEQSGFAVVKASTDPYADFRSSMVEMILERQIFGASELERLLHSYLSLNSRHHHPPIIRAFSDICEVLFAK